MALHRPGQSRVPQEAVSSAAAGLGKLSQGLYVESHMRASAATPAAAASTAPGVCCASRVLRTSPRTCSLLRTEPLPTACTLSTCWLQQLHEQDAVSGVKQGTQKSG